MLLGRILTRAHLVCYVSLDKHAQDTKNFPVLAQAIVHRSTIAACNEVAADDPDVTLDVQLALDTVYDAFNYDLSMITHALQKSRWLERPQCGLLSTCARLVL